VTDRYRTDRYGTDVLAAGSRQRQAPPVPEVPAVDGLVVECRATGYCGAVVGVDKTSEGLAVRLEDRRGNVRLLPLRPAGFLLEGAPVTLVRPPGPGAAAGGPPQRSASGSRYVADAPARVARASRIWVEGVHDAELVERVWGHDLRVEGVVVEPLHGADRLGAALAAFGPGPTRRVGVLLDHLTAGSKETRLAQEAMRRFAPHVAVVGHPFVDVWQSVRPASLGIAAWPTVPMGQPWKAGVIAALGWRLDEREAWRRILSRVRSYADLEPTLLGRVEELIDFVTAPGTE
jgi:hypothetical protein